MKRIIETKRLYLRELIKSDKEELSKILTDPESMKFYPTTFNDKKVEDWIKWNIDNYKKYRHGLWAVILKEGNIFLGDCGITIQDIEGEPLPELGYHIKKEYCNKGFATEAAIACMEYAFKIFDYPVVYTYTKYDNKPSLRVAEKNGMKFVRYFDKEVMGENVREVLYCKHRVTSIF
ncbi:GNAT family N-acetyltransferase [Spirochaeta cellobiosiphila]|uniref:GNAT family N-acetyltransferase n=1 Tax=Spirochaeta cellobiosiphila TaxID=504483 RepID=UPI00041DC39C|nr:GNAT family N-acetyltransferase [Spirochaeta cellobiosiphila]